MGLIFGVPGRRPGALGRPGSSRGDDEVLGDDDHFIIPRLASSPAGDDRGMMIHFCVILYHPPESGKPLIIIPQYHPQRLLMVITDY